MSHVTDVAIEIKDLDCLKKACERLSLEFREGQTHYRWFGQHVGDYPLPAGYTKEDMGKCLHAIGIPNDSVAYEIGVVERRDGKSGYTMHFDFWNKGYGIEKVVGKDAVKLLNCYAAEVAKQEAMMLGYTIMQDEMDQQGNVQLLIQA